MKIHLLPLAILALIGAAVARSAPPETIYSESFEKPDGKTIIYPPAKPEEFVDLLDGRLSGWSGDGAVSLTYGPSLGNKDSGGIRMEVTRPGTDYATCTLKINVAGFTRGRVTADQVRALTLVYDASCSAAVPLRFYAAVQAPVQDNWPSRIASPEVLGQLKWTTYRFPLADAEPEVIERFLAVLNSVERPLLHVSWFMAGFSDWEQGDALCIDNVRLERSAR
jgi:hypothetical protein